MSNPPFILTEMGFVSLIMIITSLIITIYLVRRKKKDLSSWLLISFFVSIIMNGITMLAANGWIFWGAMLMPAQDAWILMGGVALAQFAYHYPTNNQKKEARLILLITASVAAFAVFGSISYIIQFIKQSSQDLEVNQLYYLILPAMTCFIILIFLRRAVHFSSMPLEVDGLHISSFRRTVLILLKPEKREIRTLRDFGLALSLGLLPVTSLLIKNVPFLPVWLPSYMLSIGSVLAISVLALVYINNSGEQSSFVGKIIGVSLVSFLLIIGALGASIIYRTKHTPSSSSIDIYQIHSLVIYLSLWVIISCLIILLCFPVFFKINLVQPLNRLLKAIKQANLGDLNAQIPVSYEDEIGYLTHSFNHLIASLNQSNQERDEINRDLQLRLEELRLSEEKFSSAFQSNPAIIVLQKGDNRRYVEVNPAFTAATGYLPEEAIGHTPVELNLYPSLEEAKRVSQALADAKGHLSNFEITFRRKSGEYGVGLLSSDFFETQGENYFFGIIQDITARKKTEEEIRLLNIEMERRVAERSLQLSKLLDLSFLVNRQDRTEDIFYPALEQILEISGLHAACLLTLSKEDGSLLLSGQVGLEGQEADQMRQFLPSGLFRKWINQVNDALLFSDMHSQTLLPNPLKPDRFRSCLITQLIAQKSVLGILAGYREDIHTFSLEEVSLLVAVAEQLGISLDNQRLRQESEQAAIITERQRLARDLHDSVTQSLYGLTLFSRAGQEALESGDGEKLADSLVQIEENSLLALNEMRLMLYQMMPHNLEAGLCNMINTRLDQVERRLGIQASCEIDSQIHLPVEIETALFRIALEALNNSLKHARASAVSVQFSREKQGLLLEMCDNGIGFLYSTQSEHEGYPGLGIKNMHERAAELGARLEIVSTLGMGTRVRLYYNPM